MDIFSIISFEEKNKKTQFERYNSAMLGFALWTVVFAAKKQYVQCSISFVCALCFKQMALFYALPVFFFLLGICFQSKTTAEGFKLLSAIGASTVASFSAILIPFASDSTGLLQIAHRIFPFHRGLWEDKVANVWCAINVIVKLRSIFSVAVLAPLR